MFSVAVVVGARLAMFFVAFSVLPSPSDPISDGRSSLFCHDPTSFHSRDGCH